MGGVTPCSLSLRMQEEMRAEAGKDKIEFVPPQVDPEFEQAVIEVATPELDEAAVHQGEDGEKGCSQGSQREDRGRDHRGRAVRGIHFSGVSW